MNTAFHRDQVTCVDRDRQRTLALRDAIAQCQRSAAATEAAAFGLDDSMRRAVLQGIHTRLLSLLEQLKALS
jgi:hypothetical protein